MARGIKLIMAGLLCGAITFAALLCFRTHGVAPATGVAFALLLLWGPRCWRSIAAGQAVALFAWYGLCVADTSWIYVVGGALLEGLALGLGVYAGALVFRGQNPGLQWFRNLGETVWFLVSAVIAALPAAAAAWFSTRLNAPGDDFWLILFAQVSGFVVLAPPILLFDHRAFHDRSALQRLEFLFVAALLMTLAVLQFGPPALHWRPLNHLESLLLLPIFWGALRLPAAQATLLAAIAGFVIWCGSSATGRPFPLLGAREGLLYAGAIMLVTLIALALTRKRDVAISEAREAERRFRELLEQTHMLAVMLDYRGRITFCNPGLAQLVGWEREELIGLNWFDTFTPFDPRVSDNFRTMVSNGRPTPHLENEIQARDGRRITIRWNNVLIRDAEGGTAGVASLGENVAERRHAEEQLRLQGAALAASANGVLISDYSGRIVWVNRSFTHMSGYAADELIGQTPRLLQSGQHDAAFFRNIWSTVLAGRVWTGEITNRRKDGALYQAAMTISPVADDTGLTSHFIAVQQDVTEQRRLERRLRESENMESIGRLAGGISHAFNNLLQVIIGSSEFLLSQIPRGDRLRAEAQEIERAAKQAAGLTNQLLAFSRQQVITPRSLQLNHVLRGTENMVRSLISEDIRILYELTEDLPWIQADPVQVEQLILNLAANASEAMPTGGTLTMTTSALTLTADRLPAGESLRPGPYVCLTMRDTGPLLTPEQRAHVFEPFFSRTGQSHLSGLGLAVVDGIVRLHNGFIEIASDEVAGTSFRVALPALIGAQAPARTVADAARPTGAGQKILLVEDDEPVRKLALRILSRAGYSVIQASSVSEARELFAQQGREIAALFTDVVLTDGSGLELVAEFSAQRTGLPVLVASGYTDDKARWSQIRQQGYRYMQKPYTAEQLLSNLRAVLPAQQ